MAFPLLAAGRRLLAVSVLATGSLISGCATPPSDPAARAEFEATNDPLEPMNREIFDFNQFLDRILIKPVSQGYRTVVPEFGRNAIRNFLHNLGEPVIFANDTMQGEFELAHDTFARFLINSTYGIGGIFDIAGQTGLERQTGDFGQTLYSWGVPSGPYLVLPIFGPSDPRDAVGMGVDGLMDPFGYLAGAYGAANSATIGRMAASGVDLRSRNIETLDDLQRNAIDYYAEIRSLYRQHRDSELRHGRPAPLPNFDQPDTGPETNQH
ncbi:MAG TPA: VacJ family lipoprotein [Stellaceae bacterium]|nr:VacJ family lipoprotein [Stellaceae bacterium]